MKITFEEYEVRKIVNVHKHVDGPWFWGKYTAHPYVGCRSGCRFCYTRGKRYLGKRDPDTFDRIIRVKTNAVELLRKELARLPRHIVTVGDWQRPAEDRYRLSRKMLEIVLDFKFPLFIVERSPFLLRDLDLLIDINRDAWVGVLFSISSLDQALKMAFEPHSPGVRRRLKAMQELASAGITVGTAMMPVFPQVGDDVKHLEDVVRATADHGGICVLAGGLTMDGVQAEYTFAAARQVNPDLEVTWRQMYEHDGTRSYGPPASYNAQLGLQVRELCERYGILDRLPRYVEPGPLAINQRLAEQLFLRVYDLELEQASSYRIWAYRKAAWAVDEWPESLSDIYAKNGEVGLQGLPGVGASIAQEIGKWLRSTGTVL
jgi:DNA repair photolyase